MRPTAGGITAPPLPHTPCDGCGCGDRGGDSSSSSIVDSGSALPSPRQVGAICSHGCPLVVDWPHGTSHTEARLHCQAAQKLQKELLREGGRPDHGCPQTCPEALVDTRTRCLAMKPAIFLESCVPHTPWSLPLKVRQTDRSLGLRTGLVGETLQVARSVNSVPRLTDIHYESPGPCSLCLCHAASVLGCIVSLTWASSMLGPCLWHCQTAAMGRSDLFPTLPPPCLGLSPTYLLD